MPWTKAFCEGCTHVPATLRGGCMFHDSYASVVLDPVEFSNCTVVGDLVSFPRETFPQKLVEADRIEGYPHLYQRAIVEVETAGGVRKAYVYHRPDAKRDILVPNGDWLQRRR
mmetsp:Transcript_20888/g.49558  ORF Transcript_20888/g.49558 Transcript_20888/m.49558 type:complete len:113 (-) Transcript_20888:171-509(-)